jgi:hypothetical protein
MIWQICRGRGYARIESKILAMYETSFRNKKQPKRGLLERPGSGLGDSLVLFTRAATHTDSAHHYSTLF